MGADLSSGKADVSIVPSALFHTMLTLPGTEIASSSSPRRSTIMALSLANAAATSSALESDGPAMLAALAALAALCT
eukprot:CAMPEP_0119469410 /NCGR_PEP_ID=MMETSP1344-20130328/2750_1 /TAXON_ID=236787 /ORGANISM="Florenciella parvula, Strain CCMP2471" /LENGTH=76 /DNA_ID=CAMNT_0007501969 /DNA_START=900 /DNA_END=1126 /DNA_ORIENTATION=-